MGGRNWLDFSVGVKLIWLLCGCSKLISFQCRDRNWNGFQKMCGGRKWLVFSVWIEINSVFVSGHRNWLDIRDRNGLDFSDGVEINLFFVCGIEIDLFLVWVSKLMFLMRRSRLTFVLFASRNYLVLLYGSKLTWFLCAGRKWLVFSVGIDWLSLMWVVEIDLVSVCGSTITWF